MYIGSRSGSGTCFVAFRACAERRNFSHIEGRGNKVSKMAHETVSCSTVCLLSSRCATRGPRGALLERQWELDSRGCGGCRHESDPSVCHWGMPVALPSPGFHSEDREG